MVAIHLITMPPWVPNSSTASAQIATTAARQTAGQLKILATKPSSSRSTAEYRGFNEDSRSNPRLMPLQYHHKGRIPIIS